jgi:hypothetical protein
MKDQLAVDVAAPAEAEGPHTASPYVSIDRFFDVPEGTAFDGAYVGNLSALAIDTDGRILALSDRSVLFTLDQATLQPLGAMRLTDEHGKVVDSEGLVVDHDGTLLVATEGEVTVRHYGRDGTLLGQLPVPAVLRAAPVGSVAANSTFEGLAQSPDGRTLTASMEHAISGDSPGLVRMQTWRRTEPQGPYQVAGAYGYRVDPGLGISEIASAGDGRLLVLERGYRKDVGNVIRLYLTRLDEVADISGVAHLSDGPDARPAGKTLLGDFAGLPSLGAVSKQSQANPLLGNIEGMAVTGRTPDGRLRLLLVTDDNQSATQTTRFYFLTVRLPRR